MHCTFTMSCRPCNTRTAFCTRPLLFFLSAAGELAQSQTERRVTARMQWP
jgi:hypothetical protein